MARMFIKHNPVETKNDIVVLTRSTNVIQFNVDGYLYDIPENVCFVYKGACYAAHERTFFSNGTRVAYLCRRLKAQSYAQEMLLTDMILN